MTKREMVQKIRNFFGSNGEHWIKKSYTVGPNVCLVGACRRAFGGDGSESNEGDAWAKDNILPAIERLYPEMSVSDVQSFNDSAKTDFIDVKSVLLAVEQD